MGKIQFPNFRALRPAQLDGVNGVLLLCAHLVGGCDHSLWRECCWWCYECGLSAWAGCACCCTFTWQTVFPGQRVSTG